MGETRGGMASFTCLLLLLLFHRSYADKCTVGCHGMHTNKAYQEGRTYVYDLEGVSVTSVSEAKGDATLKLKGTVELSVKPDCIHQLRLKGVQVNGAPISSGDVEKHAVQFNYHDGHIDTEICAEPGDTQESLNIKRAVVSLFQSAVTQDSGSTTYHEKDVFGGCPTDFTFHKEGDSLVVQKHRNLGNCAFRENINQGLISSNFNAGAGIKTSPLLDSEQRIEQRFKRGILNKAVSNEVYKFRPFHSGEAGSKTVIETTLTLKGEKGDSPTATVSKPKSLIFDAPHPVTKSSAEAILSALKAAKAEVNGGVKPEAAAKFAELVRVLRLSEKNDILSIYQKIRAGAGFDKKRDQILFLDALLRSGTSDAIEVFVELVKNRELTTAHTLMLYAFFPLITHVNLPAVTSVVTLLDNPDLSRIGYLGVGHVIGKYCQQHPCENVPEVKEAIHKIREKIGNGRSKNREQENQIICALKALGNIKFLDDNTMQKLGNIAADKNVRNRVRVAAIEALPGRCSMKWKGTVLKVLADQDEDSEVRIKSYLSLVSCACPHVANQLKEILDKEPVNQVGSFIQSHLRNLRASTDPNKQIAKQQLGQIKPKTKYPEDFRKFSFNNELSYHADAFGLGSSAETNVIYSQNSYVPRSSNLNVSVELFGRSFNFLEINSRVENLDRVLEHFFGPKGTVRQYKVEDAPEDGEKTAKKISNYIKDRYEQIVRSKREIKQKELDKFAKDVVLRGTEVDQDLDIDLDVKLFGVELAYMNYHGDGNELNYAKLIDKFFDTLKDGSNSLKNFNYDIQNYFHFLDAEIVYPTGLGSALSLGVSGTSVTFLKASGKIDIPAILKDPDNANLKIALEPSVSIRINGDMIVKGFGVESGMKVVGNLHTSTASDLTFTVLNGDGIDVNVGVPKRKQDLITISSEVLLSTGPKGDKYVQPKFSKGAVYSDCFDQFSTLFGMTVCGEISFPYESVESVQKKPPYPLSGPAKFSVTLENNDVSSYHFKVFYDKHSDKKRSFEILLDTPNSKTNRKISLLAEAGLEPHKYAKLSFDSPIKKASLEGVIKDTNQEKTITITLQHDRDNYYAKAGLLSNGNKYKPILEYKVPEHIERLTGTKGGGGKQQYNVQGTVEVNDHDDGKKFSFDKVALLISGKKIIGLDGSVLSTPNVVDVDMDIGYAEESLKLKLAGKRLGHLNYQLLFSAVPSRDPNIGFSLDWYYKRTPDDVENKLYFVHGPDLSSEINKFTLEQSATCRFRHPVDFSVKNKITYPLINLIVLLDGKLTGNTIDGALQLGYGGFKFGSELSGKTNIQKSGDYDVVFGAELMGNSLKLKSKRTIIDPHKSKYKNSLILHPGGKYEADATVVYDVSKNNIKILVDADANLNNKKAKIDTALELNDQVLNSKLHVILDNVKYIEFTLDAKKALNPNGHLVLNLKNYLMANGQYNFQNDKGSGNLVIDIPKVNRKIKATGNVVITSNTKYVANVEILYDAEKDKNKRIHFSTTSDITKDAIDTKNILEILNHKLELNGNGKMTGTFNEGSLDVAADLTLPNGQYLVYKGTRTSTKNKDDKYDVQEAVDLAAHDQKGGPARKISYTGQGTDIDFKTHTFQAQAGLKFVNIDGKDIVISWNGKNLRPSDNKKVIQGSTDISGAYVPKKVHGEFDFEKEGPQVNFAGKAGLGSDFKLQGNSKYFCGHPDKPSTLDIMVDMKLPSDKLKNLKYTSSNSYLYNENDGQLQYTGSDSLTYNDDKTIKLQLDTQLIGLNKLQGQHEGTGKLVLTVLQAPPLTISGSFKDEEDGDKKKSSQNLNVNYGDKEATYNGVLECQPGALNLDVNAKASLPFEKLKNVQLQLKHQRQNEGKNVKTDIALSADEAKYTLSADMQYDGFGRKLQAISTSPQGNAEILANFQRLGDKEYKGEWKVTTPYGYAAADGQVNLQSVDDFLISINFDSDKIKPPKIHAEIANKPTAKTGRRIVITVTSDGKNIITGSTNYKRRDEERKLIIEGNGNLKIGDNTRSSSFKYTCQDLVPETDGEVGSMMILNANFGAAAIVGELKLSDKELHVFNSYCEQSKDCAHFKLQSTMNTDKETYLKHQIIVEVDLKKFNVPAEFGLRTNTEYKDFNFDHNASLYLHSSKDKSEYSYQVYAHPKESAIILTLPSRELAAIVVFDLPKTKQTGAYKLEASVYLDRKNRPTEKTSLLATGDVNVDKNSLSVSGETKFIYPSQPKDMVVKGRLHYSGEQLDGNLDLDVFAKKSQKIAVTVKVERREIPEGYNGTSLIEINSRGQQLKVELKEHLALSGKEIGAGYFLSYNDIHQKPKSTGFLFSACPTRIFLLIQAPNQELFKSEATMKIEKNLQKFNRETTLLGKETIVENFEIKDLNNFNYIEYTKDNPNNKLTAQGQLVLGQLAEVHADNYVNGAKQNLFHALVHLDEQKFLKPEFGYDKNNIIAAINQIRERNIRYLDELKKATIVIVKEIQTELKDLLDHLKKAQPNVKPLLDYYQNELNKLKNELHADETIKEIQATLKRHFGAIAVGITETLKQTLERMQELQKQLNEITSKLVEALKAVYPQIVDSYNKIFQAVVSVFDAAAKLGLTYLNALLEIVNEHQKELKEFLAVVSDLAHDVAKIFLKAVGQVKEKFGGLATDFINQLKALPIYETLKEHKFINFDVPEALISPVKEICTIAINAMPTKETMQLTDVTCGYIIKIMMKEPIDVRQELKDIYSFAIEALQSLIPLLRTHFTQGVSGLLQAKFPLDVGFLARLPGITSLRMSLVNLLKNGELPSPLDMYYTYRPTHYLSDVIPPFSKTGIITHGGHFFTFDGRHFTMPGTCNYILAQDMQDGNFSVIGHFENGVLYDVTVTEPKESITLHATGIITVNNKLADYPANTKNLHAFITQAMVNIKSDYGVQLSCIAAMPLICTIRVSGFYHGKLRGLLGDGNNEPYDDFTLPSGKIVESATEFGNAYKLKSDCQPVTAIDHHNTPRNQECTNYFASESSSLRNCFNYVNPANYRDACDHAAAAKTEEATCIIAKAYYAACYEKRVYGVTLPSECAQCKVNKQDVKIGEDFVIDKIPTTQADIVFVVEQQLPNEKVFKDMVQPLMAELRGDLKYNGINDVHIGLIGFGEKMKWPQHYTVNGLRNIEGEVKNMKFEEKPEPIVTLQEAKSGDLKTKLTYLEQRLDVEFGTFKLTDAYEEAIRYPFRPGAAKAVVGVIVTPCEKSPLPISLQQLRLLLGQKIYKDLGLTYYHVSFLDELQVNGKPQKQIVGYDHDDVYTFADSKKRPLQGNAEMKNSLNVPKSDVCADFAVSSGGAAFSSDNFLEAKPHQKKQFVQIAAKKIVDGLVNVELEESCVCDFYHGVLARPRCKVTNRREKEPVKHTKGGVKG